MVNGKTMGLICVFMCKENMHKHFSECGILKTG